VVDHYINIILDTTLFQVHLIDVYTVLGVDCTAETLYLANIYQTLYSVQHNIGILNNLALWCIYVYAAALYNSTLCLV
jgi:hypothetical protein